MYWRGVRVWRLSHGARATSDLLCGAVLARRAGTAGIAEAVTCTVTTTVAAAVAAAVAGAVATVVAIITVTAEKTIATTVTAVVAVFVAALVAVDIAVAITNITAAKTAAAAGLRKRRGRDAQGKDRQGGGEAHQLPSQELATSPRRSRAPPTSPVIIVACDEKASASSFGGSTHPLAVESMARWTSTRPTVLAVPRHGRTASAIGAAATVASKVPRSFGDGPPSESP